LSTPGAYRPHGPTPDFDWSYEPTDRGGIQRAGTVHLIGWHSRDTDHVLSQNQMAAAGMRVAPVIDRDHFKSIYFREPQRILFEFATTSPGLAVDENPDHLGEDLPLPSKHEHLREQLERQLTPLVNLRTRTSEETAR
jgi:glyoxalase family protein